MWWHNASTRRLRMMLEAIRSRDFMLHFSLDHLKGEERRLAEEVNAVIGEFRDKQQRQEALYGQFATLLDLVGAALFVADLKGNVIWMNRPAVDNLCGFTINHISMLSSLHPDLVDTLTAIKSGEQRLVRLRVNNRDVEWNITMTRYFRLGEEVHLFRIENVQTVLQQNEIEVQKKLVSVLTHEMMNSLAPIISLSDTLLTGGSELGTEETQQALQAIRRRSEGLLSFIENYRQLSRLSPPQCETVRIGDIVADLKHLFSSPLITYNIENEGELLRLDAGQMTQVLINLLKNALEACHNSVVIATRADRPACRFYITVTDDGDGILPEVRDRIFVPFFTTKSGGTGIGLSLCRQIVSLHGGTITVESTPAHTVFTITLNTKEA